MPNLDLSILVVDDTKFSSTIIAKTLTKSGYRDVRIANDAQTALKLLDQRKASVLIADWLMPGMDGLELTEKVRQTDEQYNHFTYIILLTAKEGASAFHEAFDRGIDDFIFKAEMSKQLLPRVFAADRMSDMQNSLLSANQLLIESNKDLENKNILDIETGVGNQRYAHDYLAKLMKHTESRGGASSYMLITIKDWEKIKKQNNYMICEELALGITRRLRSLIRPLDSLCRISEAQYAVIAHFTSVDHCTTGSYRRIHDGINLKSFKTLSGYISVNAASNVCTIDDQASSTNVADIELHCQRQVQQAINTGTIVISRWKIETNASYS
ncbi:MAG: sigma-B regulation protein RsbU (phosphoserine phosphatase) [Oleiphilaceae bacterium]|jgi:PleD family two-component response regulator